MTVGGLSGAGESPEPGVGPSSPTGAATGAVGRAPIASRVTSRALIVALVLLLTFHVGSLWLPDGPVRDAVDNVGRPVLAWIPMLGCALAVYRTRFRRLDLILATLAVISFTLANAYYVILSTDGPPPFPSVADFGFLLFGPLILGALVALVRGRIVGLGWQVWLDCALGSLGAASVLAVVLEPVWRSALDGPPTLATVVAVASPVLDLLVVAAVVGIAAAYGLDAGHRWTILAVGLAIFAVTDIIYALEVTAGTYVLGTPLDAGWGVGLVLVTIWVDQVSRVPVPAQRVRHGPTALTVPAVATASAVGVLVLGTRSHLSGVAVILAGATLLAAAARTQVAFRQLVRMADLRRQARTDDLTGLPNRRAMYADVPEALATTNGGSSALLLLDLDRFKEVNDSLGHHVGDRLLVQVGTRLSHRLRAGDLLSRLGGDEFAVLLTRSDQAEAVAVATKLRAAIAEPFTLDGVVLQTDVSIGIALFPEHGADLSALLRRADMAMYRAKSSRAGHSVYSPVDDAQADTRLRTVDDLRTALEGDQLVVHYQPKVDLRTAEVHGVEALVRWNHPTRGLLYPDTFIGLVEEAGLMRQLTLLVLGKALDQAAAWHASGHRMTVAVNLSASSLMDDELPDFVAQVLAERGLAPTALLLEITEESLMGDRDRARQILTRLRSTGVQIAVDDFGSGYSSLAYLRDLPIDELKLDRSFVFAMAEDARAGALVASAIALAHSLDLRMVAEGVETSAAYAALVRYGCDEAQGYHLSRPVPASILDQWLVDRVTVPEPLEFERALTVARAG